MELNRIKLTRKLLFYIYFAVGLNWLGIAIYVYGSQIATANEAAIIQISTTMGVLQISVFMYNYYLMKNIVFNQSDRSNSAVVKKRAQLFSRQEVSLVPIKTVID